GAVCAPVGISHPRTQFGVVAQRVEAAVHVDGGVVGHGAGVLLGNVVVLVAVGLQYLVDLRQQPSAFGIGHGAQCLAALFTSVAIASCKIEALGAKRSQLGAKYGIDENG